MRKMRLSLIALLLGVALVAMFSTLPGISKGASGDNGRISTNTAQLTCSDARCGALTTIPSGTWVQTWCWRDGGSYNGTPRWFRVRYSGRDGWVSASRMNPQPTVPYCSNLAPGEILYANERVWSSNGAYVLVMQNDGNLVVYSHSGAKWASYTGIVGSWAVMQYDGNFVVYTSGGTPVWSSGTAPGSGNWLVMQSDGNLVVYSKGGLPLWSLSGKTGYSATTLYAGQTLGVGQALWSADGHYEVVMQGDGNFVLYGSSAAMWSSSTGVAGSTITMQQDGNLVIYAPGGKPLWSSSTAPSSGDALAMQTDGNLVIYSSGVPLWTWGSGLLTPSETASEKAAIAWSKSLIGSPAGQKGGTYWYGCLALVVNAYQYGAGYPIRNRIGITVGANTYPANIWPVNQSKGNFSGGTQGTNSSPPAGALVFWDSTHGITYSHVAISIGGGQVVSTNVDQPNIPGYNGIHIETMAQFSQNSWNIYKGWWLPDQ